MQRFIRPLLTARPGTDRSCSPRPTSAWLLLLAVVATCMPFPSHAAQSWVPAEDSPYLQEVGWQVPTKERLTSVAVHGGSVYVGTAGGLRRLTGTNLVPVLPLTNAVRRLVASATQCWVLSDAGVHALGADGTATQVASRPIRDILPFQGQVIAAEERRLFLLNAGRLEPHGTNDAPFRIERLVAHAETLWIQGEGRIAPVLNGSFGGRDVYDSHTDLALDWGALPSPEVRDVLSLGNRMMFATPRGLGALRGMAMTPLTGRDGLPFEDALSLAPGFTNDLWIGTSRGAIRQVGNEYHYFSGRRWVPGEAVRDIAVHGRTVYLATDGGLGIIEYEPFTLLKKAAYYERYLEEMGQKRLGLVQKLEWDGPLGEYVREAGDNDGGYTGDYLAAQAYRFAVTGERTAHAEATNTFWTFRWMETITGIPGFPARSLWLKGEKGHRSGHGSGGYPAEWHDGPDGRFQWKGDTSSDELCSHFYSVTLFHDLAAQGTEKTQAKLHLNRIATHLIRNRWQLVDLDGKATRWGRWDPDYFKTDEGHFDRGLQALELLSFMKTAHALTGEARFDEAYRQLVELGYPGYTLRQRQTFPPENIAHFEDQLAFWCYANLLKYETDPSLRSLYRRAFERSYETLRIEQIPWFNFVYGMLTTNECEIPASMAHMREWPLDLRIWSFQNSHRTDLVTPPGYAPYKGGVRPFSPREREPMRWDAWSMRSDGGTGGNDVVEPSSWLLAYWMGRYHGFILAPKTTDPTLLEAPRLLHPVPGAAPYNGPPRPDMTRAGM